MPAIQLSGSDFTALIERAVDLVPRKGGGGGGRGGYGGGGYSGGGGDDDSGLSTGAIIGIILGVIAVCVIVGFMANSVSKANKQRAQEEKESLVHKGWVNDGDTSYRPSHDNGPRT